MAISTQTIINQLTGSDSEFTAEHKVLNGTILITGIIYLISFVLNYTPELQTKIELKLTNIALVAILLIIYYLSRIKKIFALALFLFYFSIFCSLTISWFMAGGLISSMPFYYAAFLCYIIFFSNGLYRITLVSIYLVSLCVLCIIEFYYPEFMTHYPNKEMQIIFMAKGFMSMVFLIIYLVYSGKKLYIKEKQNTIDLIEQYRESSIKLKQEFTTKFEQLSIRERDVFKLIIEGKTNQEISNELYLAIGTVKLHINKIYKKLGTISRRDTINLVSKANNTK